MISGLLSRLVLLVFGTLYPAYASYKTVKTKNVPDYVKWMMYWIVFALYTFIEIFADIFIAFWCPFYYELKILFVIWLICPSTTGSTYIFKNLINPQLSKHEEALDSYIASMWNQGYDFIRKIGSQGLDYLGCLLVELLRKGHLTAATYLPKLAVIAQNNSVMQHSVDDIIQDDYVYDESDLDEIFDILKTESPELYRKTMDAIALDEETRKKIKASETESDSEEELKSERLLRRKVDKKVSVRSQRKKKTIN